MKPLSLSISLAVAVFVAQGARAADPTVAYGAYVNPERCSLEVSPGSDPETTIFELQQTPDSPKYVLSFDFVTGKSNYFSLCTDGDLNYPIQVKTTSLGTSTEYTISCGGLLRAVDTQLTLVVDDGSHAPLSVAYVDKVAAISVNPWLYLPGPKKTMADVSCSGLSR